MAFALAAAMAEGNVRSAAQPAKGSYLYVAVPASDSDREVPSIVVFDVSDVDHRFARRIAMPPAMAPAASTGGASGKTVNPAAGELVRGLAVHRGTNRLYLTTVSRILALDLATDKVVWQNNYQGRCCERLDVSPDGSTIYAPAFGSPRWHVIDAAGGELISTLAVAGSPRQTVYSRDGTRAYLGAWESKVIAIADAGAHKLIREAGPFSDFLCPFTINRRASLAFATVDRLIGFEVADLHTGLVLDRIIVEGSDAAESARYECPSHGIALTPDERELWVADGVANRLHVFSTKSYPPEAAGTIQLRSQPRWVTFSSDGRRAFAATEVVDTSTRGVAGTLQDEHGNPVRSDVAVVVDR